MRSDESPNKEDVVFSTRDLLVILFRFKYRMLAAFAITTFVFAALPLLKPALYEAKSTLLIKIGREFRNRTEVNGTRQLMINQDGIINSEIQVLSSLDSIKKVIGIIKLENLYPDLAPMTPDQGPLESAAVRFSKALTVQEIKNSNVIEISFRHSDPQIVARAVNLLVEIFKEKHLEVFSDTDTAFIEKQLAQYQSKLLESGNMLQRFKQQNGIVSQEEQVKLLLGRSAAIDGETIEVTNRIGALSTRIPLLKARAQRVLALGATNADTGKQRYQEEVESRLLSTQLEEQQLLAKYPESNPLVQSVRKKLDLLKASLRETEAQKKSGESDPAYQSAEVELMNAETELKSQSAKLAALQKEGGIIAQRMAVMERGSEEILRLKRQMEIDERNYHSFVGRAEEARISDTMDRLKLANVSVIQTASVPTKPVEPKVVKVMLMGIVIGLTAGVGLAIASEFSAPGLATPQAAERRLGLKVLLTIEKQKL